MRQTTLLVICALTAALLLATTAWAQAPPADTLKVDYFSNANTSGAPDGTLRITNPNTGGSSVYAAIYVLDTHQELTECCECLLSHDGIRTLSVNSDLTSNPLTGVILANGLIKLVSTSGTSASKLAPTPAIRSWATHIQNSNFSETETASQDATLSSAEETLLNHECASIQLDGSGKGICGCGTGD